MILTLTPNPLLDYKIFDTLAAGRPGGIRTAKIPFTVGGKGINVARMLKAFGKPALALTFSGGANGTRMQDELRQQSIPARFVQTAAETRLGIELFSEVPGQHRWWIENGEELLETEIQAMLDLVSAEAESAAIIAMSGTIPGRRNTDFYLRVLERLSAFRGEIYLDARGTPLCDACKLGGFFIKHNRDESIESFGLDPFDQRQRHELLQMFRTRKIWGAMITDGQRNIILWDGSDCYEFAPAPAREISAVGCGDATLAGLIYGRRSGMSLLEASVLGLAAGAADAEKPGPCEASFEEIQQKIRLVSLVKKSGSAET
ncbi:MAG TPA: PfkB family carbohydrate kinase [Candidatus Rifleibacterium sp.]|nr:PfkB family carbohydrate kinase [Candidatus Rifleibacterium sp.]HPT44922.1 PfkB family carbohydrate kinase [Candidatus Rifleibacterium sp.]